jgi:hypothetical protein
MVARGETKSFALTGHFLGVVKTVGVSVCVRRYFPKPPKDYDAGLRLKQLLEEERARKVD